MDKFWMVYGLNQGRPIVQHETLDSAVRESKRLAGANPGLRLVVLEAIGVAEKVDVRYRAIEQEQEETNDDFPF